MVVKKHVYTPAEILREMEERTDLGLKNIAIIKNYLVKVEKLSMPSEEDAIRWFKENFFHPRILRLRQSPNRIVILNNILVHRPDFEDATHWGAYWFQKNQIFKAEEHGFNPIDLYKNDDVYAVVKEKINQYNPVLVTGVGHGDEDTFTGQNYNIIYVSYNEESLRLLENKVVHLLSCEVGKKLGKLIVDIGHAKCFAGYSDIYIFVISNFPNSYAKPFFMADAQFDLCMFNGIRAGDAFQAMLKAYDDFINDPDVPEQCKPYLLHDRECAVFYGDPDAVIAPGPGETTHLTITLIDVNGQNYVVYDKDIPLNKDVVDTFNIPSTMPEGDGKVYIISEVSKTDVAWTEVKVKYVKKPVEHKIIVDKPKEGEELQIGSTYTFKLRVVHK